MQKFFKVGVFKTLYTIYMKTTVLESLFNQPVSCYFLNKRLRLFLVDNYNIKFNVNYPKWLLEPFETKCKHVKLKLREREKLFSFFSSDSVKFIIKRG